jgi:transposase
VAAGMPVVEAAARAGVSANTITNWTRQFIEQGPCGMAMRAPGPKLKNTDLPKVRSVINKGPAGAPGKIGAWTIAALRLAVRDEFGIWYSPRGIRRLLKRLGYNWVKRSPGRGREPLGIRRIKG